MRSRSGLRLTVLALCFAGAATTGYLVSAELGAEALRREAELQLASLMQGSVQIERARLVVRGGLVLEAERVGVYPRSTRPPRPSLFASRVTAEIDVIALLTGRFRLNSLLLDDAVLEIHRDPDGSWSPPPFEALATSEEASPADDMERSLDWVQVFEVVTRTLLAEPLIADRIDVRRSRVTFYDESTRDRQGRPVELALYEVDGRLVHHWISGDAELHLRASLFDADRRVVPLRAEGWQRGGDGMRLALDATRLPVALLEPHLLPRERSAFFGGAISGELAYETRAEHHGAISLRSHIEDFRAQIDVRRGHYEIARPFVQLQGQLDIHPGRVRLADGSIEADDIALSLDGSVERPLGPDARARFDVSVGGLALAEVREIVLSLPDEDRVILENVLGRMDDGRIDRIGLGGRARLDEWGPLLVGDLDHLPVGFAIGVDVSEVRVRAGPTGWLSRMGGRLELTGDRLSLREATGLWNDEPLPELTVSIEGVSHLFRGPDSERVLRARAGPLPGLGPLLEIMRRDPDEQAGALLPPITLHVERLEHPILRWPIRDAQVRLEENPRGLRGVFESGRWAGAPFEGEMIWIAAPSTKLILEVRAKPWSNEAAHHAASDRAPEVDPALPWAAGSFEIGSNARGPLPTRRTDGRFALAGSRLELRDVRAEIDPIGQIDGALALGLGDPEAVHLASDFSLAGGNVEQIGRGLGFPADYATGRMRAAGRIEGPIRPQTPLLTSLTGRIQLDARQGEIRRDELPMLLALAQASSGYNEFATRDAVAYDSISTQLLLAGGRITIPDFVLEGPLRVYASGSIDAVEPPHDVVAVVGLFLFRSAGQIMESIPLVKAFLPGSERGLIGAYFQITGPLQDPKVRALTGKSVAEDLPDVLAAPYQLLRSILSGGRRPKDGDDGTVPPVESIPGKPAR
jgi:hypothetical protein